jgi:bifunctional UDP-N-acetylglucosamine pyrophosphorylase/glucosamine-1-phosphate N-acetyltransferase
MTKNTTLNDVAVVILAAGKGTRMKSALPKVMHKVAGKPMVMHVLDTAIACHSVENVVVLGEGMEEVQTLINPFAKVVIQQERLGTAHAVLQAMPLLAKSKSDIKFAIVLYGDTPLITPNTLHAMYEKAKQGAKLVVLGFTPDNPAEYGRLLIDKQGSLTSIIEYQDATKAQREIRLCNSGVMLIAYDVLESCLSLVTNNNSKHEYYLTDLVGLAAEKGHTCSYVQADTNEVLGVNDRQQLAEIEAILQQKLRKQAMSQGATLIAPETVFFTSDTKLGKDVIVHPFVIFGDKVVVGDNVEIKSHSHIEGTTIAQNAVVGPFARLRPGTEIGKGAKIGNFVEIKKSTIHPGAKVNHLSYIGDSDVGNNANIGAGVITCNYDGIHKYRTHIGKEAFIGSNTALIAPVSIGNGALVAAGSTITEDVGDGDLAIARSRQVIKEKAARLLRKIRRRH